MIFSSNIYALGNDAQISFSDSCNLQRAPSSDAVLSLVDLAQLA